MNVIIEPADDLSPYPLGGPVEKLNRRKHRKRRPHEVQRTISPPSTKATSSCALRALECTIPDWQRGQRWDPRTARNLDRIWSDASSNGKWALL